VIATPAGTTPAESSGGRLPADGSPPPPPGVSGVRPSYASPGEAGPLSYAQVLEALQKRGVLSHKLRQLPGGEWEFSCDVPANPDRTVVRHFEARDPSMEAAARLVLEQVEADRR
jgi:hypothetical protein